MKKIFILLTLFSLFTSFLFISAFNYSNAVSKDLQNNFFRLHILANSDSTEDQNLKLKVRDNIIDYIKKQKFSSKEETILYSKKNSDVLKQIAEKTILDNGYNYSVTIQIGNFYFPTKHYANISLPAGFYDGIKIEIGNANGQNWWCSLFPPLCFVDISSGIINDDDLENLKSNLNSEEFDLISKNNTKEIKFKFKLIELMNNL